MILFYFYHPIVKYTKQPRITKKKKKKRERRKTEEFLKKKKKREKEGKQKSFFFFFYKISLTVQHGDHWMYDGEISFFK